MTATPTAEFAAIFGVFARTCRGLGLEGVEEREEREEDDEDAVFSFVSTNDAIPKRPFNLEYHFLRNPMT